VQSQAEQQFQLLLSAPLRLPIVIKCGAHYTQATGVWGREKETFISTDEDVSLGAVL